MEFDRGHRPAASVRSRVVLGLVAVLALALASVAWTQSGEADAEAAAPEEATPVSAGVFDEAQVERGSEVFAASCASCHATDLSGDFGPRLVPLDPWRWSDAPLSELFDFVRTSMPFGSPGSLPDEDYLSVLTFVLAENGYPSGDRPLSADAETLSSLVLDDPPAADAAETLEGAQNDDDAPNRY
ncbi:MAG: cytochrome c [Trueperaceae bacterium]